MKNVAIVCDDIFGLEIYSIIDEVNKWFSKRNQEEEFNIIGFLGVDCNPFSEINSPVPFLDTIDIWCPPRDVKVVIGIKEPKRKSEVVDRLRRKGVQFETIVAPWMLSFREWLNIGEGCVIAPYSAKPGMIIGDFVTIVSSMLSGYSIGNYSTVMRFANIAGESIGERSFVGDHAFLAVGKRIGDDSFVAPGSIVVKSVKHGTCVSGVPARKEKL